MTEQTEQAVQPKLQPLDPNLGLSRNFLFIDKNQAEEYLNLLITKNL